MMQEADRPNRFYIHMDNNSKSGSKDKPVVIDDENSKIIISFQAPTKEKTAGTEITQQPQRDFKDVFTRSASGVGLGAGLIQTKSCTSCPRDEPPDNSILRSNAFTSKSISKTEKSIAT